MSQQLFSFSSIDREALLATVSEQNHELLVVGGGVTGCGIALDAASRGIKTVLVEKSDFASGTSSKSTKLIHGGLRYLKQLEIALVRESGQERAIVNKLAPHLCIPEKMLLPITEGGTFGKFSSSLGLWVYDFLANVEDEDQRVMLDREETIQKEPLLKTEDLEGGGYYAEYRTDDARLTIEIIKKAASFGAKAFNYMEVVDFLYENERIIGARCKDHLTGELHEIKADHVISAGGPWVDNLRKKNNSLDDKRLHLTKGVHIVVPHKKLPINQSLYFDIQDGRMAFAVPRGRITYIGTTDTDYKGSLDRVVATKGDRDYLLNAVNHVFNCDEITKDDIISNWAGLRPLIHEEGKSPSDLSRKDEIFEAEDGLLSIAGGKLTGYRKMSERIVDRVCKLLCKNGKDYSESTTSTIALTPNPIFSNQEVKDYIVEVSERIKPFGLESYYGWYLVTNYGKQLEEILLGMSNYSDNPELALAKSEIDFCIKNEMIHRAEDYFVRRSGRLYFDILSILPIRIPILNHMSKHLQWSNERLDIENNRLDILIKDATFYYDDERVTPINNKIYK